MVLEYPWKILRQLSDVVLPTDPMPTNCTCCKPYYITKNLWAMHSESSAIFVSEHSRKPVQETLKSKTTPEAFLQRIDPLATCVVIASATTLTSMSRTRHLVDPYQARDPHVRYSSAGDEHAVSIDNSCWDKSIFPVPARFRIPRTYSEVRAKLMLDHGKSWDEISGFPRHLHVRQEAGNYRHSRAL